MRIEFESTEVDEVGMDLSKAPVRFQRSAPKVLERGALETKRGLQRMASGHRHLGGLPSAVGYDVLTPLHYEIGFDKGGVGSLANIAVYGTSNNAPVMGTPMDALRIELPAIVRHLGEDAEDAVLGGTS
jgi:hypothetical protein